MPGVIVAESLARVRPEPWTMDWMEPRWTQSTMGSPRDLSSSKTSLYMPKPMPPRMATTSTRAITVFTTLLFFFFFLPEGPPEGGTGGAAGV